jgi:uncharacterized protein YbjQ (UPF0145 family)
MKLIEHQGDVFGVTVRTRNMFSDMGANLRNIVGGEARTYTDLMVDARREALDRLRKQAHDLGANVVVSMRMTTSAITDGLTEFAAYGAAVRAEDVPEHWALHELGE